MNWRILVPAGFAVWFLIGMAQLAEAADVAGQLQAALRRLPWP